MTPAQAIHDAVCANLAADGHKVTGSAVAALVGEAQSSWWQHVNGDRDPRGKTIQGWLDALAAAGHPMALTWDDSGCRVEKGER